jgi:hypothetical protein
MVDSAPRSVPSRFVLNWVTTSPPDSVLSKSRRSRDSLKTLLPRLQRRLVRVKHNEEKAAGVAVYDELIPRRDALAEELLAIYTEFAPKLADVLARALKIDREIKRAQQTKPIPARGFTHLDGENHLTLGRNMILPDWSNPEKRIWPLYENILTPEEQTSTSRLGVWSRSTSSRPSTHHGSGGLSSERRSRPRSALRSMVETTGLIERSSRQQRRSVWPWTLRSSNA